MCMFQMVKLDTEYVFEMQKTETIDVYNLNVVEPTIKDGKSLLKRVKIGLAFVSGLEERNGVKN